VTAGGIKTTEEEKKKLAAESHAFNLKSKKFKVSWPKQ
jgi:ubiquitin-conjugating enzyme E2 J2